MSASIRARQQALGHLGEDALARLAEAVRAHGPPDPARVQALAEATGLPAAAVRGALTFYADLHAEPGEPLSCAGTACALADGPAGEGRSVYCLGYCDRGPARLLPDETVVVEAGARAPSLPDLRVLAEPAIVTRRVRHGELADLAAARAAGAWRALERALAGPPAAVLAAVEQSGERGRGGAAFPTGAKWRRCAESPAEARYVVANGDEGDPGAFVDRVLMEADPHGVLEGMALCAYAIGAQEGVVFVRSEYPRAARRLEHAVAEARAAGLLGGAVAGNGFAFDVRVFRARGSYVCGEETALLQAIEGQRGEVRVRPPYPAEAGLYGRPTVVNNVETLGNVPFIVEHGPAAFRARGTAGCPGTKALCLSRGFARPGLVEVPFGVSLRDVVEVGGGGAGGRRIEALLVGGPMGSVVGPEDWDVPVCYDAMHARGIDLGHGGLVPILEGADLRGLLRHLLSFMADESCGRCVPCRLGSRRARDHVASGGDPGDARFTRTLAVMEQASLCAFGHLTPRPIGQLVARFRDRLVGAGDA